MQRERLITCTKMSNEKYLKYKCNFKNKLCKDKYAIVPIADIFLKFIIFGKI